MPNNSHDGLKSANIPHQPIHEKAINFGKRLIAPFVNIALTPIGGHKEQIKQIKLDDCIDLFNSFAQHGGGAKMYNKLQQDNALFKSEEVQSLLRQLVDNFNFLTDFLSDASFKRTLDFISGDRAKNQAIEARQRDPQIAQAQINNYQLWNKLYIKVFGTNFPGSENVLNSFVEPKMTQFGSVFNNDGTRGF